MRTSTLLRVLPLATAMATAAGCTESRSNPSPASLDRSPSGGGAGGTTSTPEACQVAPARAPARRLTRAEYNATVRDLLGDVSRPADAFPAEVGSTEFGNDALSLDFSRLLMEQYFSAARALTEHALGSDATLNGLLGCDPVSAGEQACATSFIENFGAKAFRRPLEPDEKQRLLALFSAIAPSAGFKQGVSAVLRTVLQSPQFLYRVELGTPLPENATLQKLDHYQVASRLSYLLWGSMPDAALFEAAQQGQLGSKEQILTEARRMIADPKAREQVGYFHRLAFKTGGIENITKDPATFPQWTPGLGRLLSQETSRFLDHVVWEGAGDLQAMLTAPYTFMNAELARYYGVSGPTSEAFELVMLDPARASGFVTQAGPLTLLGSGTQTNPVRRGLFVRADLLCDSPPPPPADLMVVPPKPQPGQTTRESFAQHSQDPTCGGCHRLLDPLGFAFESFDAVGLPRSMEEGKPIDSSGDLVGTDVDGHFNGAAELLAKVASSAQARSCYVKHWYEFGYGRGITEADSCAVAQLDSAFAGAGLETQELLVALTQIEPFLYKMVEP